MRNALRLQHLQAAVYKDETFVNTGVDTWSEQECPPVHNSESASEGLLTFYKLVKVFSFSYQTLRFVNMGTKQVLNSLVTRCGGKGGGVDTPIVEIGP